MIKNPRTPPAVIFDLDGTLLDTLEDITASLNAVLTRIGRPTKQAGEVRDLVGEGLARMLSLASGRNEQTEIDRLIELYRPEYARRMLDETRFYPGAETALTELAQAGVPMCVLSNKTHDFTESLCRRFLYPWPFVRFLGQLPGGPRKPDPTTALELAAAMDRPPELVCFVGDSDVDIETAHNAGMAALAVTWGYRNVDILKSTRPTWIIDDPREIPRVILGHEWH